MSWFALSEMALDTAGLRAALFDERAGACVSFEGWVRNHHKGRSVTGLRYQAYADLAQKEGERILQQARTRFVIHQARCTHRVGELAIGELAVWAGVSADHRDAAFAACDWIINQVKLRVPIWKYERYASGDAHWLHPSPPMD